MFVCDGVENAEADVRFRAAPSAAEEVLSRNQIRNDSIANRSRALAYTNGMGNFITINRYLLYERRIRFGHYRD